VHVREGESSGRDRGTEPGPSESAIAATETRRRASCRVWQLAHQHGQYPAVLDPAGKSGHGVGVPTTHAQEHAGGVAAPRVATTTRAPLWLELAKARAHLEDVEARHFSGSCHLDELRRAYVEVLRLERRFTVASEQPETRR
jgi:hypothetical protein